MGKSLLVRNAGENDGKVERTVKERFTLVGSTAASRGWPTQKPETRSKQLKDHFQIDKDFFGDNDYEDNTNEDNLMKNRLTKTMANYTLTLK